MKVCRIGIRRDPAPAPRLCGVQGPISGSQQSVAGLAVSGIDRYSNAYAERGFLPVRRQAFAYPDSYLPGRGYTGLGQHEREFIATKPGRCIH